MCDHNTLTPSSFNQCPPRATYETPGIVGYTDMCSCDRNDLPNCHRVSSLSNWDEIDDRTEDRMMPLPNQWCHCPLLLMYEFTVGMCTDVLYAKYITTDVTYRPFLSQDETWFMFSIHLNEPNTKCKVFHFMFRSHHRRNLFADHTLTILKTFLKGPTYRSPGFKRCMSLLKVNYTKTSELDVYQHIVKYVTDDWDRSLRHTNYECNSVTTLVLYLEGADLSNVVDYLFDEPKKEDTSVYIPPKPTVGKNVVKKQQTKQANKTHQDKKKEHDQYLQDVARANTFLANKQQPKQKKNNNNKPNVK